MKFLILIGLYMATIRHVVMLYTAYTIPIWLTGAKLDTENDREHNKNRRINFFIRLSINC